VSTARCPVRWILPAQERVLVTQDGDLDLLGRAGAYRSSPVTFSAGFGAVQPEMMIQRGNRCRESRSWGIRGDGQRVELALRGRLGGCSARWRM
jgi:hypothetical protein